MNVVGIKKRKKGKFFKISISLIIVGFIVFNLFKIPVFHSVTNSIATPIFSFKDFALKPFSNFFAYFQSKQNLADEKDELEKEITRLKIQVLSDQAIRSEYNDLLKQSSNDNNSLGERFAKVVLKPPYSSFDSLLLSGDFSNIENGTKVFFENVILGEIVDHSNTSANVKLYSASGNTFVGELPSGNQVDVVGLGLGRYEITLPKDLEVSAGDVVSYPSENIVIIGSINEIFSSDDELFNKVLFNIPIDFSQMNYVRIGSPLNMLE